MSACTVHYLHRLDQMIIIIVGMIEVIWLLRLISLQLKKLVLLFFCCCCCYYYYYLHNYKYIQYENLFLPTSFSYFFLCFSILFYSFLFSSFYLIYFILYHFLIFIRLWIQHLLWRIFVLKLPSWIKGSGLNSKLGWDSCTYKIENLRYLR